MVSTKNTFIRLGLRNFYVARGCTIIFSSAKVPNRFFSVTKGPMASKPEATSNGSKSIGNSAENTATSSVESTIKESVDVATQRVEAATKRLASEIDKLVTEGVKTVQSAATEYAEKFGDNAAIATEQAKKAYAEGQEYVKEKPVPAVLAAFAIGVLFGSLLRRS